MGRIQPNGLSLVAGTSQFEGMARRAGPAFGRRTDNRRCAIDLFGKYHPEQERSVRFPDVKENKTLKRLKPFYADKTPNSLRDCLAEGRPLYMPELILMRLYSPGDSWLWQKWLTAPSIRATGRTKQGTPMVVYAHVSNRFSDPDNIDAAIKAGLANGAGVFPNEEFKKLIKLAENGEKGVFLVDYGKLKCSTSGVIQVTEALDHPQTIPFIGGKSLARQYLSRFREVYDRDTIGVWHCDDLSPNEDKARARLLLVGSSLDDGLVGYGLCDDGRFVGVCGAERSALTEHGSIKRRTRTAAERLRTLRTKTNKEVKGSNNLINLQ